MQPGAAEKLFTAGWDILLIGFGAMLPVVTSELAWFHYYRFSLPLLQYFLRPADELAGAERNAGRRLLAFAALVAVAMDGPRMLLNLGPRAHMTMVAVGGVLVFAIACWTALAQRRARVA